FPLLRVDLASSPLVASPALRTAVEALQPGDRVVVANPPPFISHDPISVIAVGMTETIGTHTRTIDLTCVPEETHRVLIYRDPADPTPGPDEPVRWDSEASQTAASFAAGTDSELVVATLLG